MKFGLIFALFGSIYIQGESELLKNHKISSVIQQTQKNVT